MCSVSWRTQWSLQKQQSNGREAEGCRTPPEAGRLCALTGQGPEVVFKVQLGPAHAGHLASTLTGH